IVVVGVGKGEDHAHRTHHLHIAAPRPPCAADDPLVGTALHGAVGGVRCGAPPLPTLSDCLSCDWAQGASASSACRDENIFAALCPTPGSSTSRQFNCQARACAPAFDAA